MVIPNRLGSSVEECGADKEHPSMVVAAELRVHGFDGVEVRGVGVEEDIQSFTSGQDNKNNKPVDR